jgi:hypothetical protein
MKELKNLLSIVNERSKKVIPLVDYHTSQKDDSKEMQLFELVQEEEMNSDKKVAKVMYDTVPEDPRYKMLKHRLRNRLLNHLFFIDFKDDQSPPEYQHEQEALNHYYYIQTLLKKGDFKLGIKLLNRNITFSKEYEFNKVVLLCLEKLMWLYATQNKLNQYNDTEQEFREYQELTKIEEEAEMLYWGAKVRFSKSAHSRKNNIDYTQQALKKLKKMYDDTGSYNVFYQYYQLKVLFHEHLGQFKDLLKFIDQINDQFAEGEINQHRFDLRELKISHIKALFKIRNSKEVNMFSEFYKSEFDKNTSQYFEFMKWYFLNQLFTGNYQKAYELIREINKNEYFSELPSLERLKWDLFKAYLFLGKPDKRLTKNFDFEYFYSKPVKISKKQKGIEIAIHMLRFIYALENGDKQSLKKSVENLEKFSTQQLYDNANKRTRLFLKFLLLCDEKNYDYAVLNSRSTVPFKKLKSSPLPGDETMEVEVIPYETLWDRVLQDIKKIKPAS